MKEIKETAKKLKMGYWNMEPVEIAKSAFADDLVVYAKNKDVLQYNLNIWAKALETKNLKINIEKTKVMLLGKGEEEISVKLDDVEIEKVNKNKYLWVKIQKLGTMKAELNDILEEATKLYNSLNNTFLREKKESKKTKITLFKTLIKPVLIEVKVVYQPNE